MAIDFPASPTVGQTYTFNGVVYTFSAQGVWVVSTPNMQVAFRAYKSANQTGVASSVFTKVTFDTKAFDQGNCYNPALSRWTPPAGLVMITATVYIQGTSTSSTMHLSIYKNGAEWSRGFGNGSTVGEAGATAVGYDFANGSDYYEVFTVISTSTTATILGSSILTFFEGAIPVGPRGPQGDQGLPGVVTAPMTNCGRLEKVSNTQLSFKPYNGDRIKINGTLYPIPAAGIAGLGNTGVFVNGTPGQNLAGFNSIYYVYAFDNGGVVTADFRATSISPHSPSPTPGNIGTEILTGNDTRSLIGQIVTEGAGAIFHDEPGWRWVLSWFNRRNKHLIGVEAAGFGTAATTNVELNVPNSRAYFMSWADESISVGLSGIGTIDTLALIYAYTYLDSTTQVIYRSGTLLGANGFGNLSNNGVWQLSNETAIHWLSPMGSVSAGTGTFYVTVNGMIRG